MADLKPCPSLMTGIPTDVLQAAKIVGNYFKRHNIEQWKLLDIQSRDDTTPVQAEQSLEVAGLRDKAKIITEQIAKYGRTDEAVYQLHAALAQKDAEAIHWKQAHIADTAALEKEFATLRAQLAEGSKPCQQDDAHTQEAIRELVDELVRVRDVMLRECGIGVVNEVVLAKYAEKEQG